MLVGARPCVGYSRRLKLFRSSVSLRTLVGEGFVDSLVRPDRNTTGTSILAAELDGKRQEIPIEAVPGLRRMAVLADATAQRTQSSPAARRSASPQRRACRRRPADLSLSREPEGNETPLNLVILARFDPAELSEETRARAAKGVVAYSAICTHQACPVNMWSKDRDAFVCSCHGSIF